MRRQALMPLIIKLAKWKKEKSIINLLNKEKWIKIKTKITKWIHCGISLKYNYYLKVYFFIFFVCPACECGCIKGGKIWNK